MSASICNFEKALSFDFDMLFKENKMSLTKTIIRSHTSFKLMQVRNLHVSRSCCKHAQNGDHRKKHFKVLQIGALLTRFC